MRLRTTLFAALLVTVALAPIAEAGWVHQENSVFQAEKASQKHPKTLQQTLVLPREVDEGQLCVAYNRDTAVAKASKVVTIVDMLHADGSSERTKLITRTSNNEGFRCKDLENVAAGTTFTFNHVFKKTPRIRKNGSDRESVAVAGVVSTAGRPQFGVGLLALEPEQGSAPLGLRPGGKGGWFHSANSVFHSQNDNVRHPETLARAIVMSQDTGNQPLLCAGYDRSVEVEGAGRVVSKARITRANGGVERLNLTGQVNNDNLVLVCKNAKKKIAAGDIVSFEITFEDMPRLAAGSLIDMVSAVSTTGNPSFPPRPRIVIPEPPAEETTEDPGDGGDGGGGGGGGSTPPPPPSGGGSLSVADELAATRVLDGRNQQIVVTRSHSPQKFLIMTPTTRLDGNGNPIPSTVGYGPTIASCLADLERKVGSIGGTGRRLSSSERSSLQWFANINPSGPTAIRKDRNGGFHGDVYRPWLGVVQGGTFSGIVQTVNWFKSLGL